MIMTTQTPPSTTPSSAGRSPDTQFRVVRKRNRVPLSCAPCRNRKLKCNRGHPCDNCTKRGDTGPCTYATPGSRKKSQASQSSSSSPDDMQNRIDRLEGLVLSLMTNGVQSAGPAAAAAAIAGTGTTVGSTSGSSLSYTADYNGKHALTDEGEGEESEVEHVAKSIGIMKVDSDKTTFASEAHWYAILGEIAEVKNWFSEHKKQFEEQYQKIHATQPDTLPTGTAFLFGVEKPASRDEILTSFPPKLTVDLLITRYFEAYLPGIHIIHGPTFQLQYDQHWQNPGETPIIWLGLVYAMMCTALQSYHSCGDEPPEYAGKSWELSNQYRRLTAQCLILVDITSPIKHMLETLILLLYIDLARSKDAQAGIFLNVGTIVRLAMRMGYHRDPGPYANITPFQGEMRRRIWAVVRTADILLSAQAGLPPSVKAQDTNSELPRNIYDDELSEDMKALPQTRPIEEATPAAYMIQKARFVYMLGDINEETQNLSCCSYEEIMRLDHKLRELRLSIPPHLQMRPLDESLRDPNSLIMQRFSLDLLYLKCVCVLHRKFIGVSRENSRFAYSRRACIDASMAMLQHQATLHNESHPGGRLQNSKWYNSSVTNHDFLLAAMIVCLDLYHTAESERAGRSPPSEIYAQSHDGRDEMMAYVERSVEIWEGLSDHSMEAFKGHATLSVMLNKLKTHQTMRQGQQGFPQTTVSFSGNNPIEDPNVAPEHSAAMTLGMLSTGALTPNPTTSFDLKPYPASMGNILNEMPQQPSTGLSSQYLPSLADPMGPASAQSPFSSLFGTSLGFQNVDMTSANVDWDAWDSYIQGTNLDSQIWASDPTTFTTPIPDAASLNQTQQNIQQPQSNNLFSGTGAVFMDGNTPPRGNMV